MGICETNGGRKRTKRTKKYAKKLCMNEWEGREGVNFRFMLMSAASKVGFSIDAEEEIYTWLALP